MKKTLAIMLALIMALALVPTVAFAEEPKNIYVDANNGDDTKGNGTEAKPYKTVGKAAAEAASGSTIYLADGNYSTYTPKNQPNYGNKNLTFIGNDKDKVIWQIGAKTPDPTLLGTEYNGDYSFDGAGTITFRNMTLQSGAVDYLGFIRADKTVVEDCTMLGKTAYWGYTSATFKNTTFNCLKGDYALWSYSSAIMTFDNCTFNSSGKVINVYNEGDTPNVTVNFNNCTVNSGNIESLSVMNINDALVTSFTINFTGNNKINDIKADGIQKTDGSHASAADRDDSNVKKTSAQATCSKLFEFNIKHGSPTDKTTVNIDGTPVWENGKMVSHKYTDGYKDNAFTVTPNDNGSFDVTCDYCGYTETSTNGLYNDIKLERTVNVTQNSNSVLKDAADPNKYKVENSSNIAVDYTATMDMRELVWQAGNTKYSQENKYTYYNHQVSPWELLMALASTGQIDGRTKVILKFTFDKNIDLRAFEKKYKEATNKADVLMLESNMFEIADDGVQFDIENQIENPKREMTIKCNWNMETDPDTLNPIITLKGCGLPVNDKWGGSEIDIKNSGCVGGAVYIKYKKPESYAKAISVDPAAANVQVQNAPSLDSDYTIRIPIVGGRADDKFTLYYGGGSSGDSSGGSSSGGGYYYPTTTPVPVIVIPPKTGDMTVWQSILHFLGIR